MAEHVNAVIADAMTERLLHVGRVTTGLRLDVWRQLAALEADIVALLKMTDPTDETLLRARRRAIEELMEDDLAPLIVRRYSSLAALLTAALLRLAEQEAGVMQQIVNAATGEETLPELPSDAAIRRGVVETLIPTPQRPTDFAATGGEWWTRTGESLARRMGDSLLVGVALGETVTQLTARIRGTPEHGLADGLMAKARADAATLIQTQTSNAVAETHVALAQRNASSNNILIHTSILDSRTSTICLARHGLRFTSDTHEPIGHSIPYLSGIPYHPACRSSMVVGLRTGGPIPDASVTAWLKRRDTAYQDAVLGPTRARMFRAGDLSPRHLLDHLTGRPLTLEELGA